MHITEKMMELEKQGKAIAVALVGTGQMGTAMIAQAAAVPGFKLCVLCGTSFEKVETACALGGVDPNTLVRCSTAREAQAAVAAGKTAVIRDFSLIHAIDGLDAVVDATGIVEVGAALMPPCLESGKHVINLNVEADVLFGNYLHELARKHGVIYTGSAGDEPGAVLELYRFARGMGLQVLVLGKGKNNPLRVDAVPDDLIEEGKRKGTKPKMLASFVDGTKTMIEMCAVANAVGFIPDVPGMHGAEAGPADLTRIFSTEGEGCLGRYGVVDFARGVAPGVFAIVTTENPVTKDLMKYLSMGDGPTYSLYRPYHLTSLETPLTVAEAVLNHSEAIVPLGLTPYAEVSAVAKKDLYPGDFLDEIGEYTHYGSLESRADHTVGGHVPVGLLDHTVKVLRPVKKGDFIRYEDIDIPETSHKMQLRRLQEAMIERGGLA